MRACLIKAMSLSPHGLRQRIRRETLNNVVHRSDWTWISADTVHKESSGPTCWAKYSQCKSASREDDCSAQRSF
jgi:hypothetical protein